MKIIKYNFLSTEINHGTEDNPNIEPIILEAQVNCPTEEIFKANLERVKREAYNGEYTIEDDGQPEPEPKQTPEERIAELEEALALLLSGVTE